MKRFLIIAAAAAFVASGLTGCHKNKEEVGETTEEARAEAQVEPQIDSVMTDNVWSKVDPMDIDFNPFSRFGNDWMALATGSKKGFNSMTIAWGSIGQLWNKPVVIVYVSKDRYTKKLMDDNAYFTVTGFPRTKASRNSLEYIGSHSQREEPDKTANAGLTVEFTDLGNPTFTQGNICFECKKIYSDEFETDKMPSDILDGMYAEMGMHTMYIGEIVNVLEKK